MNGGKTYISGVDEATHVLVVAMTQPDPDRRAQPTLFMVPTTSSGFTATVIDMGIVSPEKQFTLFFDDVRLPADAEIGGHGSGLEQLFAGLNPERITSAAFSIGTARVDLDHAASYARERAVWGTPIGAHQAIAHPLAQSYIEIEMARLMIQKAAALVASGLTEQAGEAANMAKYAAAEASCDAVDRALQTHGGNGLAIEHGLVQLLATSRFARIAPVSRGWC